MNIQLIEQISKNKRYLKHTADHILTKQKSVKPPKPVAIKPIVDVSDVKISEDSILSMSMDEVIKIAEKAPKKGNETTLDKVVTFL